MLPTSLVDGEFKAFLTTVSPESEAFQRLEAVIIKAAEMRNSSIQAKAALSGKKAEQIERELQVLIDLRSREYIGDTEFQKARASLMERRAVSADIGAAQPYIKPQTLKTHLSTIKRPLRDLLGTWEGLPVRRRPRFERTILPAGFVAGSIGTAEVGLMFKVESVFSNDENGLVACDCHIQIN